MPVYPRDGSLYPRRFSFDQRVALFTSRTALPRRVAQVALLSIECTDEADIASRLGIRRTTVHEYARRARLRMHARDSRDSRDVALMALAFLWRDAIEYAPCRAQREWPRHTVRRSPLHTPR